MKTPVVAILSVALTWACSRAPRTAAAPAVWETAPLAPLLHFTEPVAVGDVVLLVVDGHSGAPLREAVANFDSTARIASADTLGRIRFHRVPPGLLHLRVRRVGYLMRTDSLTLPAAVGLALVVQMRRMSTTLEQVSQPWLPKPPNVR